MSKKAFKTRIIIGYSLAVVSILSAGIFNNFYFRKLVLRTENLYEFSYKAHRLASKSREQVDAIQRILMNTLLKNKNSENNEKLSRKIDNMTSDFYDNIESLSEIRPDMELQYDKTVEEFVKYYLYAKWILNTYELKALLEKPDILNKLESLRSDVHTVLDKIADAEEIKFISESHNALKKMQSGIFYSALIIILGCTVSILVSIKISKTLSAPLIKIMEAAKDIAGGDYTKTIPSLKGREFGMLSESLDEMITNLTQAIKEKQHEIEMRSKTENSLSALFKSAPIGILIVQGRRIENVNQRLCEMLGYRKEELLNKSTRILYPDDETYNYIGDKIYSDIDNYGNSTAEITLRHKNNNIILARADAAPLQVDSTTLTLLDISKQRKAEEELKNYQNKLEAMVKQRTAEINETVKALEKRNKESKILANLAEILQACSTEVESYKLLENCCSNICCDYSGFLGIYEDNQDIISPVAFFEESDDYKNKIRDFQIDDCWGLRLSKNYISGFGEKNIRCNHYHDANHINFCFPITSKGELLGLLHLCLKGNDEDEEYNPKNIDQLKSFMKQVVRLYSLSLSNIRLRNRLKEQSIIDPLTGLYNRRHMEIQLNRELSRSIRNETPLGIIMLDVDHFKHFNDSYGHDAGDEVLRQLGILIKSTVRNEDVACRYGGEEFLIIFPDCSRDYLINKAENIREAIENKQLNFQGELLNVTASIGAACHPDDGCSCEKLITHADSALFKAKKEGRNRVV